MSEELKVNSVEELLDITHVKSDEEVKRLICRASMEFHGQVDDLYSAVGCLIVGRLLGWRVIRLTLTPMNYAKYQRILALGLDEPGQFHFNKWMRERERLSYKSLGLRLLDGTRDFWLAVKGRLSDLPLSRRREVT